MSLDPWTTGAETNLFLQHWRGLPNDLKLYVLEFVLCSKGVVVARDFGTEPPMRTDSARQVRHFLFPLMSIHGLKSFVLTAFYSTNVTLGWYENFHRRNPDTMLLPPPSARPLIRHLKAHLSCINAGGFEYLAAIADGTLGFGKMKSMHLFIMGLRYDLTSSPRDQHKAFMDHLEKMEVLKFDSRDLLIECVHDSSYDYVLGLEDPSKAPIMAKFSLKGQAEFVQQKDDAFHIESCPDPPW